MNSMKLISGTQVENEGLQLNGRFESGRSSEIGTHHGAWSRVAEEGGKLPPDLFRNCDLLEK